MAGDNSPLYFSTGIGAAAPNYFQGEMGAGGESWTSTSTSFVDPTNSGGNALATIYQNGITVTAAASNLPGLTFTPNKSSAVYFITATITVSNESSASNVAYQFTDGSTAFAVSSSQNTTNNVTCATLSGIYVPGTANAVTVKIQMAVSGGTAIIQHAIGTVASITWTILQVF